MNLFHNNILCDFGGGFAGGGGAQKTNTSISETKDNSITAGGDNVGGGEDSITVYNSDQVAIEGLKTVREFLAETAGAVAGSTAGNVELAKSFAQLNYSQTRDTTEALKKLAETKVTDGANLTSKTAVIALAIGGAVFLLSTIRRK